MRISFTKMNGAGNDFVMIHDAGRSVPTSAGWIRSLCDRKRGVGADGVILVRPEDGVDFRMVYFNRDGGEAEMCGNGARCASVFAASLGLGRGEGTDVVLSFVARPGRMRARVSGSNAAISMTDARSFERAVGLLVPGGRETVHVINSGVPHAVVVEDDWSALDDAQVAARGRGIRYHEKFAPAGVNADFVHVEADGRVAIRTYERGVEAETLACGTGAVASAVVLAHLGLAASPVSLVTHGMDTLAVSFRKTPDGATDVVLDGPAAVNFEGWLNLEE
ncbi:MAG: diaminopimelate epimerase [Candidatus Krumholzibacteriota bacterium]|nr:diaminopimelate epimerase [Candidatus Krumholzibacteriota bacterium]